MNIGRTITSFLLALVLVGCATTRSEWKEAQDLHTIESYGEFLTKHPESEFSNDAKASIEELYWQKAGNTNTVESYSKYIDTYPDSSYVNKAEAGIEKLYWQEAKDANTIEAYRDFLERNPQNPWFYRDAKIAMLELDREARATTAMLDSAWSIALKQNTIEGYQVFKAKYPGSDYISDANKRIQELKWNSVRGMNRREEYERFWASYPNSEYSYEAMLRASLVELKITKTDKPQIMSSSLPFFSNILPDTEVVPLKDHVFIIVTWSFLPIRDFTINLDKISFFGPDNDHITGTYKIPGGHWQMTKNIMDKILRSKNLVLKDNSGPTYNYFYQNKQQDLRYLFCVPVDIAKGSKVSIGRVDFFVDNYVDGSTTANR